MIEFSPGFLEQWVVRSNFPRTGEIAKSKIMFAS
ncbi:hypothetical protein OOU_Y34scaffold00277g1 [Pyricularia oryzae Y34]|uniref:Uncharacterized protein n=2 Tax=Pyricularia oryzae TaxID=318829 RepID=A0AA97P3U3_PYRO3|nr:hypothetical protein OOU_Y34scaffold00277g1 [Pyricularia oryzae Y34]